VATQGRRRALGQHFLKDQNVSHSIAETAVQEAVKWGCSALLEIGPGKGAITLPILQQLARTPAIQEFTLAERDQNLVAEWKGHAGAVPFRVESGDFLDLPDERWLGKTPLAVVSNLPYSAGTAILTRLAKHFEQIPVMVLMFQQEVAERVRAEASTPHRGSLSLWIQNRWDVRKLLWVPPKAFSPPPQVNSEVVVLTARSQPRVQMSGHEKLWETLLKTCFAHRRKMLRSNVPWQNALELSGIDGTKRAEALDWDEWDRLFQAVRQVTQKQTS
jgi:16S rRNA (adenine1518-N6/adenine1519-N6)-dimethyltransferase